MEDPTTDNAASNEAGSSGPSSTGVCESTHSTYRDQIVDRTGELLESAFGVAEKHIRATAGLIKDPRDSTAAHVVLTHEGVRALPASTFDEYRLFPLFRSGTARLTQLVSFIALINRFKLTHSAIFANDDMKAPRLTAIFDYHPDNLDVVNVTGEDGGPEEPPAPVQNMHHKAVYAFPLSKEWQAWIEKDAKPMSMGEFARFLEDHIVDVSADPVDLFSKQSQDFVAANRGTIASPSKLIEISRGLKVYENSVVKEAKNLSTGEAQFAFESEHTDGDGKPLVLPTMFSITIPVFARSQDAFRLIARFRYRKTSDGLLFWYELWRPDLTFETAFNEAIATVEDQTLLPVFVGAPET